MMKSKARFKIKTLIIILFVLSTLLFLCSIKVGFDDSKSKENSSNTQILYYGKVSGGYYVKGITNTNVTSIVIPDEYNGEPVVAIGAEAFANCKKLTSVTISKNIKKIGAYAFSGCNNLTNATFKKTDGWETPSVVFSSLSNTTLAAQRLTDSTYCSQVWTRS